MAESRPDAAARDDARPSRRGPPGSAPEASDSYDAFLSYGHEDSAVAERISARLRAYRPPRASGLSRRLRVFRDVERLTAGASLGDLLVERIEASRHRSSRAPGSGTWSRSRPPLSGTSAWPAGTWRAPGSTTPTATHRGGCSTPAT